MSNSLSRIVDLGRSLKQGKVLVIYGARRVGKTTLLSKFLANTKWKYRLDSGDNIRTQHIVGSQDFSLLNEYVAGYELIAIDEAQQIKNIGMGLKIIVDQHPRLRIIATGSSSFELAHQVGEPLTGRKKTLVLYPIAQLELIQQWNAFDLKERLSEFLVYGSYPEVVVASSLQEKKNVVRELANSYVLKDVLTLGGVKGSKQLLDLLKLLAFQVGSLVSLNEIGTQVQLDVKTVARYLDILEKAFVIKRIGGFTRNMRGAVISKSKYYFLDNGVRNGLISQFNPLSERNDVGALFENFVMMERLKLREYKNIYGDTYFWRTYGGKEIDIVEDRDGKLFGFEVKWQGGTKTPAPREWKAAYPQASYKVITRDNYFDFVTKG